MDYENLYKNALERAKKFIEENPLVQNLNTWIKETFSNPVFVVLYIIWICAIWFHLTHGFWSALQTLGWSGKIWLNRWKCIGFIYTTLLMLGFLVVILAFAFKCAPSLC